MIVFHEETIVSLYMCSRPISLSDISVLVRVKAAFISTYAIYFRQFDTTIYKAAKRYD